MAPFPMVCCGHVCYRQGQLLWDVFEHWITPSISGRICALCARFVLSMSVTYYSPLRYETHVRRIHYLFRPFPGSNVPRVVLGVTV
jgi:hypothetical protein